MSIRRRVAGVLLARSLSSRATEIARRARSTAARDLGGRGSAACPRPTGSFAVMSPVFAEISVAQDDREGPSARPASVDWSSERCGWGHAFVLLTKSEGVNEMSEHQRDIVFKNGQAVVTGGK
jgi:hypothetical protein